MTGIRSSRRLYRDAHFPPVRVPTDVAHRAIRRCAVDGRARLLSASAGDPRARVPFNPQEGGRARLEGQVSPVLYLAAIVVALRSPRIADAVLVATALLWLILDRRIEKRLAM